MIVEKDKKYLTIREAIRDIVDGLLSVDCVEEIADLYSFLEGGDAGICKVPHPLTDKKAPVIWYKPEKLGNEEFYHWREFENLLTRALEEKLPEEVAWVYTKVLWVHAHAGRDSEDGELEIWVETEMEHFRCKQCGHCCFNLSDAYCNSVLEEDVERWRLEGRADILKFVDERSLFNDIWICRETGEKLGRCPWLKRLPENDRYSCRIHHTKPTHCRNYPGSKRHAIKTGCKGFDSD